MKRSAKILKFKTRSSKPSKRFEALIAILEDIEPGDATVAEATPNKKEYLQILMRKVRAQRKRVGGIFRVLKPRQGQGCAPADNPTDAELHLGYRLRKQILGVQFFRE